MDLTSQQIKLNDGRTLGYAEYGNRNGKPVFFFHGNPSSRLHGLVLDEAANQVDARIIAIDRPGFGLSDFKTGRRYLDWPDDVIELADNLRTDHFSVIGVSAGGPYAAACAYKIPGRLMSVALISSPCPFDVPTVIKNLSQSMRLKAFVGRRALWLVRLFFSIVARSAGRDPVRALSRALGKLPEMDKVALSRPEVKRPSADSLQQAFRSGTRGAAWDYSLMVHPWGFRLQDISIEIQLWHGELDLTIPASMGRYLATTIPNCRARFLPEGHFLIINHAGEILSNLVV